MQVAALHKSLCETRSLGLQYFIHIKRVGQTATSSNMLFFPILLLAATATTVNAFEVYCNGGTAGDGGCEANGTNTYCVRTIHNVGCMR